MNVRKSTLRSATFLTVVSATMWVGSALATPLPASYPPVRTGVLHASVSRDRAPTDGRRDRVRDLLRQVVGYPTNVATGTVVIDTEQTYLYYVLGDGTAIRYGIGVGRDGFGWSGTQAVTRMAEWPDWTPPQEMIARQPYLPRWMAGGPGNPLGSRAIYLGGTVYRIHGTNAPATIGTRISSGCIRLINADVIDLYSRVTVGTKVIVLPTHDQVARSRTSNSPVPLAAGPRTTEIY